MNDGTKKDGRGGAREGAGRKRTSPEGTLRKGRTLRASDSEWEIIKNFARVLKHDPERAARMMKTFVCREYCGRRVIK